MLQNYNTWRVLKVFFDNPNPKGAGFQLREISRKANLAPTSVKKYLDEMSKNNRYGYPLIQKSSHRIYGYPVYVANRASELFRLFKKIDMIISIEQSELLDYLSEKCMPDVIILFGSASRGEDLIDSDVDIYLQCKEVPLELKKYEKIIKREIRILFEEKFDNLSDELRNNIINGVILKGYLKVF